MLPLHPPDCPFPTIAVSPPPAGARRSGEAVSRPAQESSLHESADGVGREVPHAYTGPTTSAADDARPSPTSHRLAGTLWLSMPATIPTSRALQTLVMKGSPVRVRPSASAVCRAFLFRHRRAPCSEAAACLASLRPGHSFALLLIAEGHNVVEVARQAGQSPNVALDTYAELRLAEGKLLRRGARRRPRARSSRATWRSWSRSLASGSSRRDRSRSRGRAAVSGSFGGESRSRRGSWCGSGPDAARFAPADELPRARRLPRGAADWRARAGESGAGGHHRRVARAHGGDDLLGFDALEVDRCRNRRGTRAHSARRQSGAS